MCVRVFCRCGVIAPVCLAERCLTWRGSPCLRLAAAFVVPPTDINQTTWRSFLHCDKQCGRASKPKFVVAIVSSTSDPSDGHCILQLDKPSLPTSRSHPCLCCQVDADACLLPVEVTMSLSILPVGAGSIVEWDVGGSPFNQKISM